MNERNQIALKLIATHIILPVGLILLALFIPDFSCLLCAITQTVLFILVLSGYWEFFGIAGTNFEITFPLKHGRYLITDGGNSKISRLMNYHFYSPLHKKNQTNYSMLFATDLVKIKKNKKGFIPRHNEEYPIFGEKVYCPMAGQVVKVENNIDDNEPFIGHYPYNTGNTVVIRNGDYYFLLGHLKKGSIEIAQGETLKQNDPIGQIGNSGFSERPHLHMQLIESKSENYWKGKGICIRYKGQNLYKNRMIEID
jgi:hypothetical protein